MKYRDLRDFISQLEAKEQLKRIDYPINPYLEVTEVCDRTLKKKGPALLFTSPKDSTFPLLANVFGTAQRVAMGMGAESTEALREIGELLAFLKQPDPPQGIKHLIAQIPKYKQVLNMAPKVKSKCDFMQNVLTHEAIDLAQLPIQTCWPKDAAPLITWALVITKGVHKKRQNIGIYRQQVIARNKVIMRWLSHRGGALDYQDWCKVNPDKPFPITVVLGADPATMLAAVTPIPDDLSEYAFAGLLRGHRSEVSHSALTQLDIPASSEIVLEGFIYPNDTAVEGPFGDHTGYYNESETFPVFTIEKMSFRDNAIYHSTYTGRPPDEPAILGVALNEVFVPILIKQFPEISDFYLPPEGCSYRLAIVSIKKQYPGHAKRIMFGIWSFLRQFMYTKFIIVTDDDINIRQWTDVIWAMTTRMDPARDTTIINNTPIDYLDFASPISGLGSKMAFDATNKWPGETQREWGIPITMEESVIKTIDDIWNALDIC